MSAPPPRIHYLASPGDGLMVAVTQCGQRGHRINKTELVGGAHTANVKVTTTLADVTCRMCLRRLPQPENQK